MFNSLIIAAVLVAQQPINQEVTFEGVGGLRLNGTLTLPAGSGKFPAMLLLPGSGPTDRDGNSPLLPTLKMDVLKEIAERLAKVGIASYRYDKRAVRTYQAKWPKDTAEMQTFFDYAHFAGDADAAYNMLASRPEIDSKRVGALGHSEGATYALQVGADLNPKAVVSLSGLGRKMSENLHDQIETRLKQQAPALTKEYVDYTDKACAALAAGQPLPPNTPAGLKGLFNISTYKWLGDFCRLDPLTLVAKYKGPMLAINGAWDQQVSPKKDFIRLVGGMQQRPGAITKYRLIGAASHCLKTASSPTDDAFTGPIVPEAMDLILSFLKANL